MPKETEAPANFWPATQPDGYADFDPTQDGEYKALMVGGREVAVVWTNWNDGTGILWVESNPIVLDIFKKLIVMYKMGETAGVAYSMLDTIEGTEFGPATQGKLSGVSDMFDKLTTADEDETNADSE